MRKEEKKLLGFALILVAVIFLLYILERFFNLPIFFDEESPQIQVTKTGEKIPPEVHTFSGTVQEIGANYIKILVLSGDNYVVEDTPLQVEIREGTQIVLYSLSKSLQGGGVPAPAEVSSSIGNITLGSQVMVYTQTNARNLKQFQADKIIIMP